MLARYKKSYQKIAMGLLSFMPNEKDVQKLQSTMLHYETENNHQLYLWKEETDIIGIIGVVFADQPIIQIKHISVNPSHRGQGIGKKMVIALKELHPDARIIPDEHTAAFCEKCGLNESCLLSESSA